jgi:3-phosphoshikimate 1-carboxyvinyltransferase
MPARARAPRPLRGEVRVPGDKSISHRALIFAALSAGRSRISNLNTGADVVDLMGMLGAVGAPGRWDSSRGLVDLEGCGWEGLIEPDQVLDAGNSGTALRLMTGVCAGIRGASVLTGDGSVRRRPMLRVVEPLRNMGASIDGRRGGDRAPLLVRGGDLSGIKFDSPVASAQVKSAVLVAALAARGETTVTEPHASRDHTERMLAARGVPVTRSAAGVSVTGGARLQPVDQPVPGDISSAMFLIVGALLIPGSDLTVADVGLNPTRTSALDVLKAMGGRIEANVESEAGGEPFGTIRVEASHLHGVDVGGGAIPGLIDEVPVLAVAAAFADGETWITGASELRVKESDRISSLAEALGSVGVQVRELPDGLLISGPAAIRAGDVDARMDHRIAMALAVAGLVADEPIRVRGWESVATSFPEFLDIFATAQDRK